MGLIRRRIRRARRRAFIAGVAAGATAGATAAAAKGKEGAYCKECGEKLHEESKFCPRCGFPRE